MIHSDVDEDGDIVWNVLWTDVPEGGNVYIQSSDDRKWDLRNFEDTGRLEFKIKALSLGDATAMYAKADSVWPALGQVDILDQLQVGEWVTVSIPIATLLANPGDAPLNLYQVWTPFVLQPNWDASNVEVRLNDIRWVRD